MDVQIPSMDSEYKMGYHLTRELLREHPELQLVELPWYEGFAHGRPELADGNPELTKCVRIFPHRMAGEGHFLALLYKKREGEEDVKLCLNANYIMSSENVSAEMVEDVYKRQADGSGGGGSSHHPLRYGSGT